MNLSEEDMEDAVSELIESGKLNARLLQTERTIAILSTMYEHALTFLCAIILIFKSWRCWCWWWFNTRRLEIIIRKTKSNLIGNTRCSTELGKGWWFMKLPWNIFIHFVQLTVNKTNEFLVNFYKIMRFYYIPLTHSSVPNEVWGTGWERRARATDSRSSAGSTAWTLLLF